MSREDPSPSPPTNGHEVSRAEHDTLKASVDALHTKVDYVVDQVRLIGAAMELLLKAKGLDDD